MEKIYRIRGELGYEVEEELGWTIDRDMEWTLDDVKTDAENYGMSVDEFIDRYLEIVR